MRSPSSDTTCRAKLGGCPTMMNSHPLIQSGGLFRLGPVPVVSVSADLVHLGDDVKFVSAEANPKYNVWARMSPGASFVLQ